MSNIGGNIIETQNISGTINEASKIQSKVVYSTISGNTIEKQSLSGIKAATSKLQGKVVTSKYYKDTNYEGLSNKPSINSIILEGNKTAEDLGLQVKGNYANKDDIPTKTSQLENDSGFLTKHQDLSAYAKKTDIPDTSNFVTKDVEELTNYYIKDEIDGMMIDLEDKIVEIIGDIETLLSEV